jgi:hypothetical protein
LKFLKFQTTPKVFPGVIFGGLVVARVLKISGHGLKIMSGKTLGMVWNLKKKNSNHAQHGVTVARVLKISGRGLKFI